LITNYNINELKSVKTVIVLSLIELKTDLTLLYYILYICIILDE